MKRSFDLTAVRKPWVSLHRSTVSAETASGSTKVHRSRRRSGRGGTYAVRAGFALTAAVLVIGGQPGPATASPATLDRTAAMPAVTLVAAQGTTPSAGDTSVTVNGFNGTGVTATVSTNGAVTVGVGAGFSNSIAINEAPAGPAKDSIGVQFGGYAGRGNVSGSVRLNTDGTINGRIGFSLTIGNRTLGATFSFSRDENGWHAQQVDPAGSVFSPLGVPVGGYAAVTVTVAPPSLDLGLTPPDLSAPAPDATPTGFEGSPEVGPEHAEGLSGPAEDATPTGFEGSPEVGPEHAEGLSGPAEDATPTGFEGSPEVGPEHADDLSGPADGIDGAIADADGSLGTETDDGMSDTGMSDGGMSDGGMSDGGMSDGGMSDGGMSDGGMSDGGMSDGGMSDGGMSDGGMSDGGMSDGGMSDGGMSDGGMGGLGGDTGGDSGF
jgi:hypothetical protein